MCSDPVGKDECKHERRDTKRVVDGGGWQESADLWLDPYEDGELEATLEICCRAIGK